MEQWTYNKTYFGIPQGSGCSPILANIYLNELDEFMQELKDKFDVGECTRRKVSYEYESVRGRTKRLKKKYAKDWNEVSEEERTRRAKKIRDLRAVYMDEKGDSAVMMEEEEPDPVELAIEMKAEKTTEEPLKPVASWTMSERIAEHEKKRMLADGRRERISVKEKLNEMREKINRQKVPDKLVEH